MPWSTGPINTASGPQAFVGGGTSNTASGRNASVCGGASSKAQGPQSWAGGRKAYATHPGSFVWGGNGGASSKVPDSVSFTGIRGATVTGLAVLVAADHQLGTATSSIKFKENVKSLTTELPEKLDLLSNLNPVQFNYKSDAEKTLNYGLIAEEVLEHYPELVTFMNGEVESVMYHLLPALLLGEIQRLRTQVDNQRQRLEVAEAKISFLQKA